MNHGAHVNGSWYTYEWIMSHMVHGGYNKQVSYDESWHTYEWFRAHMWISHGTRMNSRGLLFNDKVICRARRLQCAGESWVMIHIWVRSYVLWVMTHICYESWLTHVMRHDSHMSWVMAHDTHMSASCHLWIRHGTHMWLCFVLWGTASIMRRWVMSYIWMSHVIHMNEWRHAHINEAWYTYEWVMSHILHGGRNAQESHASCVSESHVNESCTQVMEFMRMTHGTHVKESWHTYQGGMVHIWMRHGTPMNES